MWSCKACWLTGQQALAALRRGELRRIEFFVRKLRARSSAAADVKDWPWGGIRVVIVASDPEVWDALRAAANGSDMQLASMLDRLQLENVEIPTQSAAA